MRIAVVADIHGNVRALRAVMEDLKQVAPDSVVNLGDCASGPLEAAETVDVLMSLAWTTIRGNHDRQLLDRFAASVQDRGPVCDLGCGPGHVARYLSERKVQVCGVDLSPEMVKRARHWLLGKLQDIRR